MVEPVARAVEASTHAVALLDLLGLDVVQGLQDGFARATGVASMITTPEGVPLTKSSGFCCLCRDVIRGTEKGRANCARSDAAIGRPNPSGPVMQPCLSGGLWDGGASVYAGDFHVANWLVGQVRNEELNEDGILAYAREIGADEDAFRRAYAEVPVMSTERFRNICDFLFLMANQLSALAYDKLVQQRHAEERERLENQLHQSRQLQLVGQLAGGIAHDFNNLLTTILGNVDLVCMDIESGDVDPDAILEKLAHVHSAGTRASDLTRQLLGFARKQVSAPVVLDVNDVLRRFEPMVRRLLPEHIRLEFVFDPDTLLILADQSQLEQVALNLVVNARDAMPDGGLLRIEAGSVLLDQEYVEMHPDAHVGTHVVLTVSDTGVGMRPEVRERVFEPFFTTKPVGKGTGLGLATVYGIVHQAGGSISVYSELGHGTVFRVYWPVGEGALAELAPERVYEGSLRGTESILLCEDADAVRDLAVRILERAGYHVIAAANGEEALRLLAGMDHRLDLLFTDVVMPGMNGRVLAAAVQQRFPGLPVLYASGYTANVIAHHGVLEEGVALLEKPYSYTGLLKAVRRQLGPGV
jgi:signal transduction histidine kinase